MNIHWINQRRPQAANQSMTAKTETIRPAQFFSTFHKWRSALAVGSMLCGLGLAGAQAASIASWDFTGASTPATQAASPFNANLIGAPVLSRGAGAAGSSGANSFRTVGFKNDGISTANTDY